jgi:AmpD protein
MIVDDGWLREARCLPSPNADARPSGELPSLLVIHNISLPPGEFGGEAICEFFTNRLDCTRHPFYEEIADLRVSAHLLIDREGNITQFVSFLDRAWHAGVSSFEGREKCNDFAIGIELEGTDSVPYTDRQYRVLADVARALMTTYPAIDRGRVVGHCDIAPGRKTDPGEAFDWRRFHQLLV